jgi:hypothetical protein
MRYPLFVAMLLVFLTSCSLVPRPQLTCRHEAMSLLAHAVERGYDVRVVAYEAPVGTLLSLGLYKYHVQVMIRDGDRWRYYKVGWNGQYFVDAPDYAIGRMIWTFTPEEYLDVLRHNDVPKVAQETRSAGNAPNDQLF